MGTGRPIYFTELKKMPYSPEGGGASLPRLKLFAILMSRPVSIKIDRHTQDALWAHLTRRSGQLSLRALTYKNIKPGGASATTVFKGKERPHYFIWGINIIPQDAPIGGS